MDPEKLEDLIEEDDEEAVPQDREPRMFQSPDSDLLPGDRQHGSIRRETTPEKPVRHAHAGMLPSELAGIRRRSSVHRPPMQFYPAENVEKLSFELRKFDAEEEKKFGEDGLVVTPMLDKRESIDVEEIGREDFAQQADETSMATLDTEDGEIDFETFRFGGPLTKDDLKEEFGDVFTLNTVKRKLPILEWLPKYSRQDFIGDFVAGLTVGLTVVPQCLAYAVIADIKLEYGLNSAYIGCFIYALLGTSKDVTVGPTAILSLLTGAFIRRDAGNPGDWAILLCFCVGCFQLLMGVLRLGFLINFISTPVVSGFTQAAVIVIILSQVKNMMGVKFGTPTDNVPQTLVGYWKSMPYLNGWDVLMGVVCITLLLLMREMKLPDPKDKSVKPSKSRTILKETIRLLNVSRYAIVVVMATVMNFLLTYYGVRALSATGKVNAGLSMPQLPNFNVGGLTFGEILSNFGFGLVLVPLLATMESIAVAKTFAHKFRYNIYTTQEFIALGMANLVSSFFGAYPVTGAFTRSALNAESGVRTPMGCVVTGSFVMIAIVSLSSVLEFIPKSALAAVIICACLTMFDFQIIKELFYIRKPELFVLFLTLICCLVLRVELGLLIGLTISVLMLVYPMARPVVIVTRKRPSEKFSKIPILKDFEISVTPKGAIFFPAAEYVKNIFNDSLFSSTVKAYTNRHFLVPQPGGILKRKVSQKMELLEALPPIVFDGIHLTGSDYSTLRALRSVVVNCRSAGREITFVNTSEDILNIIDPSGRVKRKKEKKTRRPRLKFLLGNGE